MLPDLSAVSHQPSDILCIKPSSLGDVVHALPAVARLKRRWPASHLRWLINPEWASLLEGNPHVDEVVLFPRGEFRGPRGILKIVPWARALRGSVRSELVVDFQGLLRSALIGRVCRREKLLGLSDAREGARYFYDQTADVRGIAHAVDRYLALARFAIGEADDAPLEWPLPQGSEPAGFDESKPFVLLHPFSRGAGKSLSSADVDAFCAGLAPMRVVVAGRAGETFAPLANVTDLLNRTSISELIWLIRRAEFVVSVDSGPMHIAAAITSRLLSIHTWSDPEKVGPYRRDAWIWKDSRVFQRNAPTASRPLATPAELAAFIRTLL